MVNIIPIKIEQTYPLRHAILRPNHPVEACYYLGDDAPTTRHLGAFLQDQLVGICSIYEASHPSLTHVEGLQLRAMATASSSRGLGIGQQLLNAVENYAQSKRKHLWANARSHALGFYQQAGFEVIGDEFSIRDIGPHRLVVKRWQY